MAEVGRCLSSRADKFALKMCRFRPSKSHASLSKSVFLPVGSVFNAGMSGADRGPAVAPPDGDTRLHPPSSTGGSPGCPGPGEDSSPGTAHRNGPRYGGGVQLWRTLSVRRSSLTRGHLTCVRLYSGTGSGSEPLHKTKTGYYDILEVQPAATQAQIKTAYYKQSFLYHPDRNAGSDEATVRFSDINEAYTVLGNKALRRKYDRGLLTLSDLTSTRRPSGKEGSGPGAQQSRQAAVSAEQRGRIYDFDSFFRSHYSEQLQRQKDIRVRREELQRQRDEKLHEMSMGRMTEVSIGVMLLLALGLLISLNKT